MARGGKISFEEFLKMQKNLEKSQKQLDDFIDSCAKEVSARLLRKVIKRTPVGDYSGEEYTCASGEAHKGNKVDGKMGGTLRRGWTAGNKTEASKYLDELTVHKFGGTHVIEIINPIEYASYVEYGHRKVGGKGWVEGHFMLTKSENEIRAVAPRLLDKRVREYMGDMMK